MRLEHVAGVEGDELLNEETVHRALEKAPDSVQTWQMVPSAEEWVQGSNADWRQALNGWAQT